MEIRCEFKTEYKSLLGKIVGSLLVGPIRNQTSLLKFNLYNLDINNDKYFTVWQIRQIDEEIQYVQPDYTIIDASKNKETISFEFTPFFSGKADVRLYFLQKQNIIIKDIAGNKRMKLVKDVEIRHNIPIGTYYYYDTIYIHNYNDAILALFAIVTAIGAISEVINLVDKNFTIVNMIKKIYEIFRSNGASSNYNISLPLFK